ncbi:MAG: phytanoyl-CoA dioxygenase family protein [Bryobacteraceae bacterium]
MNIEIETAFVRAALTGQQIGLYHEQGFLVVGRTLTDEGLDRLRSEVMEAWRSHKGAFDPDGTWLKNALLPDIHHHSRLVRDYYFDGPLVDMVGQIIGPNIKAATAQLTFKLKGNTQPFAWHQDNGYGELDPYNAISTLTALDDVDVENGCLWLIPGSHRQGQAAKFEGMPNVNRVIRMEVEESKAVPLVLKAGEAFLMNCWMLHQSGPNTSGRDRRILFMRYADADAVEVYNGRKPRLGRLLRGATRFPEVQVFEAEM